MSRLLPLLLIVFGVVFQTVTPIQLTGTPFFVAAPLMAAPLFARWETVAFGGLALLVAVLLHFVAGSVWKSAAVEHLATEMATIVFVSVMAVLLNVVVRRGRAQLASAREVAEAAQRAVLPAPAERLAGLRLAVRYEAAQQDALIGGDLYAARATPYGVRLVMGDVRGKGLAAIETVSVVLGAFREAADREPDLPEIARSLESALARERASRGGVYGEGGGVGGTGGAGPPGWGGAGPPGPPGPPGWGGADGTQGIEGGDGTDGDEAFVTCVLVEIPPDHRMVRVLNCGHPAPLLIGSDGGVTVLTPRTFRLPLGLSELAPAPHRPDAWQFPPAATLLLYTDGLSEARDDSGAFYDPADRLTGRAFSTPARLLSTLVEDVRRFSGGFTADDMALLAAHRPRPLLAR
ncbi:PP2C family protein-serine/threonine phosphatase [Streptomyces sp. NPDC091377]|uniref:PP2C family protein-serine/threonine phosphatase n=1 Tax=Streptomyces sp. NPDC091377 TaxID=3365995 RepID=UPI003800D157